MNTYDAWADSYDIWHGAEISDEYADLVVEKAGNGMHLELGAGTGRLTLPIAQRLSYKCVALDDSTGMLSVLARKASRAGLNIDIAHQDMATFSFDQPFQSVACWGGTFYHLMTLDRMLECLSTVRRHLEDTGFFFLEGFIPKPSMLQPRRQMTPHPISEQGVRISVTEANYVKQTIKFSEVSLGEVADGQSVHTVESRYVTIGELELMAKLTGWDIESLSEGVKAGPLTPVSTNWLAVLRPS